MTIEELREMCGYVEDGSHVTLCIGQDDATRLWSVTVDNKHVFYGRTMTEALRKCQAGDKSIPEQY